ncbi:hypothetical protein O181_071971 [Austropuccinia psidii MF-1]|uniref:Uncharacterized protein n=1 Tax=Austropuccinia psidii MF-1 TaxID=1389203 RepID=A0A9Q3I700_9BASI|nr:hypothetical protein [Austropuccinia psidii MF-1]
MDNKRFNLASHWAELGECFQKVYLKEIRFKELEVITKGLNLNRKFKLLEKREAGIGESQATIQAINEQLKQKEHTMIPSGSQGLDQPKSPVASHHSGTNRSVAKNHHSSQSQVRSRRRQGSKGNSITPFNQRHKELDPMIQKLLDLVKEVQKCHK